MKTLHFKTYLLLVLIGFSCSLLAQTDGATQAVGVIKGNVSDSITGEPLEYVAIALRRNNFAKVINGVITDDKGNFRLENIPTGTYKLTLSFVGYENKTVPNINITATNAEFNCKKISLSAASSTLKTVEITAEKKLIEQRVDRIVYNVEKDAGAATQTLNDVLRKVPLVSVDAEGKPSLRGNSNVQVLINGKPSGIFAASVADALRTIPTDQVVRIEVLTSVSAKYDAEGTAGIINIITKKKQVEGYNGTTNIASGHLMGNSSSSINVRTGKIGFNAALSGNALYPRTVVNRTFRKDFTESMTHQLEQNGSADIYRTTYSAQLGLDYDFNSQNSLTSTFRLANTNLVGVGRMNTQTTLNYQNGEEVKKFYRDMGNLKKDQNFDWTTDFKRTFKNPKDEFSASIQWSHYLNDGGYFIDEIRQPTQVYNIREKGINNGKTDELTAQTDYTKAVGKTTTLDIGLKNIYRKMNSLSDYMEYRDIPADYVRNDHRSNDFNYLQNVSAAYAQLNFKIKTQWTVQTGSRFENTFISSMDAAGQPIRNNYLNWTPSVMATYETKKAGTVRFSYNRRIQRPGLSQLNPFINSVDPRNLQQGNMALRPEIANNIEVNYSRRFSKAFIYIGSFYNRTNGLIEKIMTIAPSGISITTYQNIGINQTYGGYSYVSLQPTNVWTVRGGFTLSAYKAQSVILTDQLSNHGLQFESFLASAVSFKNGFSLDATLQYEAPKYTLQGTSRDLFMMILSAKKEILQKKGAISVTAMNPFCRNLIYGNVLRGGGFEQIRTVEVPFRTVTIGFNYKFGKAGTLRKEKKTVENDDVKKGEKDNY